MVGNVILQLLSPGVFFFTVFKPSMYYFSPLQLEKHSKELATVMRRHYNEEKAEDVGLRYYREHTAQIEVSLRGFNWHSLNSFHFCCFTLLLHHNNEKLPWIIGRMYVVFSSGTWKQSTAIDSAYLKAG